MRTLAGPATLEIDVKRSKFIAHAARVDSMAATLDFYQSVADPGASHNCWAWRLDYQYRFNDDGEPSSSAGKPILATIEGKEIDHVMVVVTRHFGGVKLGIGGLVRAYSGCAAKCLDRAGTVELQPTTECVIKAGFSWTGQLYAALDSCGAQKLAENYMDDGVEIRIEIAESSLEKLKSMLRDMTRGEVAVMPAN
jgi:uncharacterized YigZ family protein